MGGRLWASIFDGLPVNRHGRYRGHEGGSSAFSARAERASTHPVPRR